MNAAQKAEALRLADALSYAALNLPDSEDCGHAAALLRTLAAEPQGEPVAWLYTCQKPGNQMKYSSVDDNDTYHWPVDQWKSIVKSALYLHPSLAAEPQKIQVRCETNDGIGCAYIDPVAVETEDDGSTTVCVKAWPNAAEPDPAPAQTPLTSEPVAWIQPDHLQKARVAPFLCRVEPTKRMSDFVPIFLHPAQTTLTHERLDAAIDEALKA